MAQLIATEVDTDFMTKLNIKTKSLLDIINLKVGDIMIQCILAEDTEDAKNAADALKNMMILDSELHDMIHVSTKRGDK